MRRPTLFAETNPIPRYELSNITFLFNAAIGGSSLSRDANADETGKNTRDPLSIE